MGAAVRRPGAERAGPGGTAVPGRAAGHRPPPGRCPRPGGHAGRGRRPVRRRPDGSRARPRSARGQAEAFGDVWNRLEADHVLADGRSPVGRSPRQPRNSCAVSSTTSSRRACWNRGPFRSPPTWSRRLRYRAVTTRRARSSRGSSELSDGTGPPVGPGDERAVSGARRIARRVVPTAGRVVADCCGGRRADGPLVCCTTRRALTSPSARPFAASGSGAWPGTTSRARRNASRSSARTAGRSPSTGSWVGSGAAARPPTER